MNNIDVLNKLLNNELSAMETYQQALEKLRKDAGLGEALQLLPIYEDHKAAVSSLQEQIYHLGGRPLYDSGIWEKWAKMDQEGTYLLDKEVALNALREGEQNGVEDYEQAVQDSDLPLDVRYLIQAKMLLKQHSHIRMLDMLISVN
jgi:uncharacterized protein (TIGR02284 family)